jgi:hypothetical protein
MTPSTSCLITGKIAGVMLGYPLPWTISQLLAGQQERRRLGYSRRKRLVTMALAAD